MFDEDEYKTIFEADEFVILETDSHYYLYLKTENSVINVADPENFPNCDVINVEILKNKEEKEKSDLKCSDCVYFQQSESYDFNEYGDYITVSTWHCKALRDIYNTNANTCPMYSARNFL